MRGMVLAAGLGTRLRPLSYELPKPIVPVIGRPLCTYNMEFLVRAGVRSFVLNLHTHPKLIQQRVTGWAGKSVRVEYTVEPVILGTGGGIWNAREFLSHGTSVAINGDTILSFPFSPALAFHRKKKALSTMILFPDPAKRYTPVWVDDEGRVTGIGNEAGRGTRSGFYTGCQILEPELYSRIPPGRPSCIIRETYVPLLREGAPIFGLLTEGYFQEFGTPKDYLEGTLALLSERSRQRTLPQPENGGVGTTPPVYISQKAKISKGARIGPEAVIEEGASIAEGASVSRSIVWPGASLRAGEKLAGAILTPRRLVPVP